MLYHGIGPHHGGTMPVTARLSKKFYERLGEDVTNELVEWLNSVDTAYRSEFRDLFEAHFGRFEARLQHGLAELRGEFRATQAELRTEFNERSARLESRIETGLAQLRGELTTKIEAQGFKLILWSFGFWVANVGAVFALLKLTGR